MHAVRHFGNMQCNCLYLFKDTLSTKKKRDILQNCMQ